MGVCVADYDNDGFQDVYLTAFGPNALFRNNGNGTFTDVTPAAGVGDTRWSTDCAFGDYDRDGDVDLYVANYVTFDESTVPKPGSRETAATGSMPVMCGPRGLPGEADVLYRNDGNGTFTDVTSRAGIRDPGYYGFGVLFTDLDDDGWPDIFVANDSVPNLFFRNNRNGTFAEEGLQSGLAVSGMGREQAGMGVDAGDYRRRRPARSRPDQLHARLQHAAREQRRRSLHRHHARRRTWRIGPIPYMGWGVGFVDIDNDGLSTSSSPTATCIRTSTRRGSAPHTFSASCCSRTSGTSASGT